MTGDHRAADLALLLFLAGPLATFGARTWARRRRTGATGFSGNSGPAGSAGWWDGVLFVAALLLAAGGFGLTVAARSGIGASRRVGVDRTERADLLVTTHGSACAEYTARVGRLLPGVGRSRTTTRDGVR